MDTEKFVNYVVNAAKFTAAVGALTASFITGLNFLGLSPVTLKHFDARIVPLEERAATAEKLLLETNNQFRKIAKITIDSRADDLRVKQANGTLKPNDWKNLCETAKKSVIYTLPPECAEFIEE